MGMDYPEHLLAREPAPPYDGEGPFALWHFSEESSLDRLSPHTPITNPEASPLVWAVDTRHAPMFWFPRDCPRGCIWPVSATTPEDRERFFGQSAANRVHVMEAGWLKRMRDCRLYAYRLPAGHVWRQGASLYENRDVVQPVRVLKVDDLAARGRDRCRRVQRQPARRGGRHLPALPGQ